MNARHLILLSLILLGCPDEERFEPLIEVDAMIETQRDQGIDQGSTDEPDASSSTEVDMETVADVSITVDMADPIDGAVTSDAVAAPESCSIRFTVVLPENTVEADRVFLAGTFCQNECGGEAGECCNWIPNDPQWAEASSPREENVAIFEIQLTANTDYQYKYTLGDWDQEELGESCQTIANRTLNPDCPGDIVYEVRDVIDAWKGRCP